MKVENQLPGLSIEDHLLEQFQVEELEKRYEFGWETTVVIGPLDPPDNPIPVPEPPMPF